MSTDETDDATIKAIREYVKSSATIDEKYVVSSDRYGRPSDITTTEGHRLLAQHRQTFNDREVLIVIQVLFNFS